MKSTPDEEIQHEWFPLAVYCIRGYIIKCDEGWAKYVPPGPGSKSHGYFIHDGKLIYSLDTLTGTDGYMHKLDKHTPYITIYIARDMYPEFKPFVKTPPPEKKPVEKKPDEKKIVGKDDPTYFFGFGGPKKF